MKCSEVEGGDDDVACFTDPESWDWSKVLPKSRKKLQNWICGGTAEGPRKLNAKDIQDGVISVDLSGPDRKSYAGNKYALVACVNKNQDRCKVCKNPTTGETVWAGAPYETEILKKLMQLPEQKRSPASAREIPVACPHAMGHKASGKPEPVKALKEVQSNLQGNG